MESARNYLPAAGHDWFLPLYDPIVKLLGGEAARKELLERAGLRPGNRVLDIGCGTGTLAMQMKRLYPLVEIVGIDPDPKALARAKRKAASASAPVQFDQGFADVVLISQDAGWYDVGEPKGGTFRPYTFVFANFIPSNRYVARTGPVASHR